MSAQDLYELLQVDPSADAEVLHAAYRALARKRHPDAGGSAELMAELNRAWAVLSDARSRAAYDRRRAIVASRAVAVAETAARQAAAPAASSVKTLDFGRYKGWSLVQLAQEDPDYLRWLAQTPSGRIFRDDVDALLGDHGSFSHRTAGFIRRMPLPAK